MGDGELYEDICCSDIISKKVKFVWKIKVFSTRRKTVTSPLFPTAAPEDVGKWYLELNPNDTVQSIQFGPPVFGEANSVKPSISIRLHQKTSAVRSAKVKFSIINSKGAVTKQHVTRYTITTPFPSTKLAHWYNVLTEEDVLTNDELNILCELFLRFPINQIHGFVSANHECRPCQLKEDLGNLLSSKTLSDVTIAVGGEELRAHKAVLAARSAVFAAMFSNQVRENVVKIKNMDAEVFNVMLEFIYTDKEISQTSGAHDLLLAAANKYQLERLKSMCEEALCKALSLDNVLQNLTLADLHNVPRLKEKCKKFVLSNRAEVLRGPSWDDFKHSQPSLVVEILEMNSF